MLRVEKQRREATLERFSEKMNRMKERATELYDEQLRCAGCSILYLHSLIQGILHAGGNIVREGIGMLVLNDIGSWDGFFFFFFLISKLSHYVSFGCRRNLFRFQSIGRTARGAEQYQQATQGEQC